MKYEFVDVNIKKNTYVGFLTPLPQPPLIWFFAMKAVNTAKNKIPWGKSRMRTIVNAQTYDNILIQRRTLYTLFRLSKGKENKYQLTFPLEFQ